MWGTFGGMREHNLVGPSYCVSISIAACNGTLLCGLSVTQTSLSILSKTDQHVDLWRSSKTDVWEAGKSRNYTIDKKKKPNKTLLPINLLEIMTQAALALQSAPKRIYTAFKGILRSFR